MGVSVGGIKYWIISRRGDGCGFVCHARHFSNRWSYTRFFFSFTYFILSVLLSHSISPNIMSEVQASSFLSTDSFFFRFIS